MNDGFRPSADILTFYEDSKSELVFLVGEILQAGEIGD